MSLLMPMGSSFQGCWKFCSIDSALSRNACQLWPCHHYKVRVCQRMVFVYLH